MGTFSGANFSSWAASKEFPPFYRPICCTLSAPWVTETKLCWPIRISRADGHSIPAILQAVLQLMPLDTYCWSPASVMDVTDSDRCKGLTDPPVWATYRQLLSLAEKRSIELQTMERFDFYDRARKAFAIVHTGETALYGNIILKMGVIDDGPSQTKSS